MSQNKQFKFRQLLLLASLLMLICIFLSGCVEKAQEEKVYKVGILSGLNFLADTADGFKAEMSELGYVEGKDIVYDIQEAEAPVGNEHIIKKFVEDNVDLIFVYPTEASIEAKAVTEETDVPVVFAIANIEGTNLVESIRQPGRHITGVRYPGPDIAVKRFEIMLDLVPDAKQIWIPYFRGYPIVASQLEVLYTAAEPLGIRLEEIPANDAAELEAELDKRAESNIGIDAIMFIAEPLAVTPDAFEVIGKFAAEHNVPVGGAIMSVGGYESVFGVHVNNVNVGKQAAKLADKILKGTPAGTIPVVSAESYFQLNYKSAQELGLDVSEGLLSMADEIIR
jgi:putative ABC transport system substrate-binding protein